MAPKILTHQCSLMEEEWSYRAGTAVLAQGCAEGRMRGGGEQVF